MTADTLPSIHSRGGRVGTLALLLVIAAGGMYVGMRWHAMFERWLGHSASSAASDPGKEVSDGKKQLWTCGMHPQVIQDHPGDCPICHMKLTPLATTTASSGAAPASTNVPTAPGQERKVKYWTDPMMNPPYIANKPGKSPMGMDLVPVYEDATSSGGTAVVIDPASVQNMGVRFADVTEGALGESIRVTAMLDEPEPGHRDINLRVSGWIQTLYANTDGMEVKQGEPLFDLYSPELRLAIEELITARKGAATTSTGSDLLLRDTSASLATAAESRLVALGLTPAQVGEFAAMDRAPSVVTFLSPMSGHVTEKVGVYSGSSVTAGQRVLRLAERSTMWVEARVPESELGRVHVGQKARARVDAYPERTFEGEVIFIHPHFDEMTRTALVRMTLPNHDYALHQGMFATIEIAVGSAEPVVLVPREAVIDSGESRVVFVSAGEGRFEPRKVQTGRAGAQGLVQVLSGLKPGERVVASGQFLIDSESRLREAIQKFLGEQRGEDAATSTSSSIAEGSKTPTEASAPAARVDEIVRTYLGIAEKLGATQSSDEPMKMGELTAAIESLATEVKGKDGERLVKAARSAAEALAGQPLEKQRVLFKKASAAIISLVDAMPPSPTIAGSLHVVHCPMAKADWLQRSTDIANPYYAEDMKECGSIVRSFGAKGGGTP